MPIAKKRAKAQPPRGAPSAPSPPPAFRPPSDKRHRRNRPRRTQVAFALDAATELRRATTYEADFGQYAPSRELLATRLEAAKAWNVELGRAAAWLSYVEQQDAEAWEGVFDLFRTLGPMFAMAAKHGAVRARYHALGRLLDARKGKASKTSTSKRAKKRQAARAVAKRASGSGAK